MQSSNHNHQIANATDELTIKRSFEQCIDVHLRAARFGFLRRVISTPSFAENTHNKKKTQHQQKRFFFSLFKKSFFFDNTKQTKKKKKKKTTLSKPPPLQTLSPSLFFAHQCQPANQ
jgi:hypothetical protein